MVLGSGTASWEFQGLRLSKADMELYGVTNICCCSPCVGCAHHRVLMALRPWVKGSDRWRYPGETREQHFFCAQMLGLISSLVLALHSGSMGPVLHWPRFKPFGSDGVYS